MPNFGLVWIFRQHLLCTYCLSGTLFLFESYSNQQIRHQCIIFLVKKLKLCKVKNVVQDYTACRWQAQDRSRIKSPRPNQRQGVVCCCLEPMKSGPYATKSCSSTSQKFHSTTEKEPFLQSQTSTTRSNVISYPRFYLAKYNYIHSSWHTLLNSS